MALRVRTNGKILCAAKSEPLPDDIYIDDNIHGLLAGCYERMDKVIESLGEDENGQEEWVFLRKVLTQRRGTNGLLKMPK